MRLAFNSKVAHVFVAAPSVDQHTDIAVDGRDDAEALSTAENRLGRRMTGRRDSVAGISR
jgi:hypothetical protein